MTATVSTRTVPLFPTGSDLYWTFEGYPMDDRALCFEVVQAARSLVPLITQIRVIRDKVHDESRDVYTRLASLAALGRMTAEINVRCDYVDRWVWEHLPFPDHGVPQTEPVSSVIVRLVETWTTLSFSNRDPYQHPVFLEQLRAYSRYARGMEEGQMRPPMRYIL